jgi:hypothetical protein
MTSHEKPNFSQGWGMAGFITLLAVGAFVLAGVVKSRTFHAPTDPSAPATGAAHAPAAAADH